MSTDEQRLVQLASILALSPDTLGRHIMRPLAPPMASMPNGWHVPETCSRILATTDGFWLFGNEAWNGFKFWGSQEYQAPVRLIKQIDDEKLFPIFGEIPHLVSISSTDGAVVASDWEEYHKPEQGWGEVIAPTLQEYIRTLIQVREAYGYEEDQPSDWWHPYASHGDRYDLEE